MPTTTSSNPFVRAKVIAHSVYPGGPEIVSVQATGQRFILSELNTHRSLNKNSASSRAIPFPKQVQKIIDNLAYPEAWASEQKGMQGGGEIEHIEDWVAEDGVSRPGARTLWERASAQAIWMARDLAALGVHKSIVNRLLEPFMWHTVVLTGTAWENFFDQRCSPLAQPEIRVMAEAIRTAIQNSTPRELDEGEWHLPYVDLDTACEVSDRSDSRRGTARFYERLAKISAARCARVSYLTQEGKRDIKADLDLYAKLTTAKPPHWSPLEHVATPWPENRQEPGELSFPGMDGKVLHLPDTAALPRIGNLLGWRSLRVQVEAEQGVVTYR
ncbi:MAG: hypothetical protein HOV97_05360 [Nonomuraea sp.]|nr:hypothetical protein [Nonomuraea sp.]